MSLGQLVQVPRRVDLRRQHPHRAARRVSELDHAVVEHARGVHHRAQRVLGRDRRRAAPRSCSRSATSHAAIATCAPSARSSALQLAGALRPAAPRRLTSSRRRTPCSPPGGAPAARPSAPVPPVISTVPSRIDRGGQRQHVLADVARLAHEAERLRRAAHVPGRDRQRRQHAALEQLQQLAEHLLRCARARLPSGRTPGRPRPDGSRRPRSGSRMSVLPISMKRPPPGSSSSEASTNSPRQRVEHDIHALPAGRLAGTAP